MIHYKKKAFFVLLLLSSLFIFLFNQKNNTKEEDLDKKIIVSVSSFALYDITRSIAKDSLHVFSILPFGVDPHSYEPTPKTMANIEKSALVIYSGSGLEPWIHNYTFKKKVLDISKFVHLRKLTKEEEHEHHHIGEHESGIDPHYWLSIENMKIATNAITKELKTLKPENELLYAKRQKHYLKDLDSLAEQYRHSLRDCKRQSIVVSHNAYGYLSEEFGFKVISLNGLSPEAHTDAKNIQKIIETIKKQNISLLFSESFANTKTMHAIANEESLKVDTLDALGNITADEMKRHLSYKDIMQINLHKITKALECN